MNASVSQTLKHDAPGGSEGVENRPTVLCIDDDPEVSRSIALRLDEYGIQVIRAFYGMQGFWLAMTEQPDLIITDVNMPQGHGDYVVECLKKNSDTRGIPVIVLTGFRDDEVHHQLLGLGVEACLTKPCPFDVLFKAIEKYIPVISKTP